MRANTSVSLEGIAEVTKRPLYTIRTSELGVKASYAEKALEAVFRRAEKWNAVVLLDEADLFLTKRTANDLDRNALVILFLHTLDYFKGVMFLTSNRVEEFDLAFASRIHLRIPFQSPDTEVRLRIWRIFLKDCVVDDTAAERLARDILINGREIRNLMRMSLLLSKHRNEELSEALIKSIYDHTKPKTATGGW